MNAVIEQRTCPTCGAAFQVTSQNLRQRFCRRVYIRHVQRQQYGFYRSAEFHAEINRRVEILAERAARRQPLFEKGI